MSNRLCVVYSVSNSRWPCWTVMWSFVLLRQCPKWHWCLRTWSWGRFLNLHEAVALGAAKVFASWGQQGVDRGKPCIPDVALSVACIMQSRLALRGWVSMFLSTRVSFWVGSWITWSGNEINYDYCLFSLSFSVSLFVSGGSCPHWNSQSCKWQKYVTAFLLLVVPQSLQTLLAQRQEAFE